MVQYLQDIKRFVYGLGWVITILLTAILTVSGAELANNINGFWGTAKTAQQVNQVLAPVPTIKRP